MSIRILSGVLRGSILSVPNSARPTLLRFRQSVFDLLTGLSKDPSKFFHNKVILDCFAGSGALAIEALSRGAKFAYFVDIAQESISMIYDNTEKLQLKNKCKIFKSDVLKLRVAKEVCDIVFIDPPYGKVSIKKTLRHLLDTGWIDSSSLLITEEDSSNKEPLSQLPTELLKERLYGRSVFKIFKVNI